MTLDSAPTLECPACRHPNGPTARFCSGCGARLAEPAADAAERRQLTVLFADLVGSAQRAAALDPEDWRNMVRAYQEATAEVIRRYEGHIAQFLGDGILVYFGYPKAHEDDAERALLAGLGIVEALEELNESAAGSSGGRLDVRIGVHTGPVVVGLMGSGGRRETLAVGHTTNVAARLQGFAEPNTVIVSEATRRLTAGQFVTRDLGTPTLKGIGDSIRAHCVLRPSGVRSRLDVASELTPFVGRDEELDLLLERWARVREGEGQVALVAGEPGVGKSRLLLALRQRFAEESHTWLECRCSPYAASSAFAPIRELVQQGLGFEKTDTDEEKLAKLARRVSDRFPEDEALPVLASFLEIQPASAPAHALSAEVLRERSMHFLVEWGLAMSSDQPVLMLVEDLHWCDPSSLEFLERLISRVSKARMFVLMTARPEFRPQWESPPNFTSVVLGGLTAEQAHTMVERLCGDSVLPEGAADRIVARADGVPLHVEELTKMLLESTAGRSGGPVDDVAIPETLEGLLMARLDHLNQAKQVAQVASLLGREFDYKLLETVSPMEPPVLEAALGQLVDAGLVFAPRSAGDTRYTFKHALIQDAAYQSMLKSKRREYHRRTARALENVFPAVLERQPELVARHDMEAEDWPRAAQHWLRAGLQATRASANREAITYLQAGLTCVGKLGDSTDPTERAERTERELELLVALGPPLMATRGYADEDVERGYSRARELCRRLGEPPAVFPVMFGLWTYHCLRAKHVAGRQLAADLTQMAEGTGDESLLLEADLAMGANLFFLGEFDESRRRLARSIAAYDAGRDESHRYLYGQDPRVGSLGYEAFDLWLLGQTEQALASSERELELARSLDHPFSLTYALTFAAWFHRIRGDADRCRQLADELHQLSSEREVALYRTVGVILCGSAMVEQGQLGEGLDLLQRGMAEYRQTGSSVILPYWEGLHADALRRAGRIDEGQAALDHGFQAIELTEERWCEAELHRYRAVLLASRGAPEPEIESAFEQSIRIARRQGARAWALRATLGLFRHTTSLGRGNIVRARLEEIRSEFSPRSAEPELTEVDALLASAP